ncbi:MAG: hypothetical protein AB1898_17480 [Acidobacteriota bacterium]
MHVPREGFGRERSIFPETVLAFIRETQPKEWAKLEALHGEKTGEQILADLYKWMDANGSLATLRHGFKYYGRTLPVAYFNQADQLFSDQIVEADISDETLRQVAAAVNPNNKFQLLFTNVLETLFVERTTV